MPYHVHGIIELRDIGGIGAANFQPVLENFQSLLPRGSEFQKLIPRSIGSIVKGFKIMVTKWFRQNTELQTVWQRNYYKHIIRNEQSYHRISHYIKTNPQKWKGDKFNIL